MVNQLNNFCRKNLAGLRYEQLKQCSILQYVHRSSLHSVWMGISIHRFTVILYIAKYKPK